MVAGQNASRAAHQPGAPVCLDFDFGALDVDARDGAGGPRPAAHDACRRCFAGWVYPRRYRFAVLVRLGGVGGREREERAMRKTVGTTDRVVRLVLAAGAVAGSGLVGFASGWGIVLLVVAGVMVVTAATGYCPAYSILGIETTSCRRCGSAGKSESPTTRAA
jgi:ribosomal protein L40E